MGRALYECAMAHRILLCMFVVCQRRGADPGNRVNTWFSLFEMCVRSCSHAVSMSHDWTPVLLVVAVLLLLTTSIFLLQLECSWLFPPLPQLLPTLPYGLLDTLRANSLRPDDAHELPLTSGLLTAPGLCLGGRVPDRTPCPGASFCNSNILSLLWFRFVQSA